MKESSKELRETQIAIHQFCALMGGNPKERENPIHMNKKSD